MARARWYTVPHTSHTHVFSEEKVSHLRSTAPSPILAAPNKGRANESERIVPTTRVQASLATQFVADKATKPFWVQVHFAQWLSFSNEKVCSPNSTAPSPVLATSNKVRANKSERILLITQSELLWQPARQTRT